AEDATPVPAPAAAKSDEVAGVPADAAAEAGAGVPNDDAASPLADATADVAAGRVDAMGEVVAQPVPTPSVEDPVALDAAGDVDTLPSSDRETAGAAGVNSLPSGVAAAPVSGAPEGDDRA
ncbi:MAG TPA: hypothetical protein VIG88_12050, partial [Lysobacter sp.]